MKARSMGDAKVVSFTDRAARLVHPAVVLLVVSVLAYGLLLPQMGFFWDELPMSWIRYELGPEAMTKYFSTNRPAWGMLYQLTTAVMPHIPIYWEVFALLLAKDWLLLARSATPGDPAEACRRSSKAPQGKSPVCFGPVLS